MFFRFLFDVSSQWQALCGFAASTFWIPAAAESKDIIPGEILTGFRCCFFAPTTMNSCQCGIDEALDQSFAKEREKLKRLD
jgi:hypothetical protein